MSIGTYSQLQTAVRRWMLRTSSDLVVTTEQIQNYISLCEAELNRELRVRELEEEYAVATVAGQNYVALPSDFRKVQVLEFNTSPHDLNFVPTKGDLRRKWGTENGRPKDYTIFGDRMYFGPIPDGVYNLTLDYYAAIVGLSDALPTNDILTRFPDVYLYGSLRHGYVNTKDQKNKQEAESNYVAMIARIKDADLSGRMPSDARLQTRNRLA